MRVVIAGDYPFEPPHVLGGIQAVTYYTTEALREYDNLDLHVITCEQWTGPQRTVSRKKVTVHYLKASSILPYSLASWTSDRKRIREKLGELKPDIVHVHAQNRYPLAALDSGLPWVMTVHGLNHLEYTVKGWKKNLRHLIRTFLWARTEQYTLRRAKDIVVISPYVQRQIELFTSARLHMISNPVHEDFFRIRGVGLPGRILCVSLITPRKDLLTLLRAVERLHNRFPNIQLHIVGKVFPITQHYADSLHKYVQDNGLTNCVRFLGFLSHEDLLREYEECQVFALPSLEESSPVAIAEAVAAGRAVLTTDIGGTAHLIADNERGFRVMAGNDEMMAARLRQLLDESELRERFRCKGKEWALQNLMPHMAAEKTFEMYETILRSRSAQN